MIMQLYKNHIPIGNIYYMLCYAFKDLQEHGTVSVNPEEFENIQQLMSEIIIRGVSYQLKKGLLHNYEAYRENLSVIRGKIDISETLNNGVSWRKKLVCDYDEYTEDTMMNRILKSVMLLLIRSDIKDRQKTELRRLVRYLSNISQTDLLSVRWESLAYSKNHGEYRLLMSVCRIICENMLHSTEAGDLKLTDFSEKNLNKLYEKFILNYYVKHFPNLNPVSAEIKWAIQGETILLPKMQSDIMLTGDGERLIIDAKFYSHTTQTNYEKNSFHSHNLYQIFTYVKNEAAHFNGKVSGMLLYARTDDDMIPNDGVKFEANGNSIAVKSLDLSGNFKSIVEQLNEIADGVNIYSSKAKIHIL